MRCPVDQSELQFHSCGEGGFYECGSCHGLWIGFAAQEKCFQSHQRAPLAAGQKPRFDPGGGRDLRCPDCDEMPRLDVLKVEKIEIDRCPACRGIWLDAGEFQAILEWQAQMPGPGITGRAAEGVSTVADPVVAEAVFQVIEHAGEFSKEAAGAIADSIGDILGGIFSGF